MKGIGWKCILKLWVISVCLLFVSGCSVTYKEYDYEIEVVKYSWGELKGRLIGCWHPVKDKEHVFGSPYKLFLSLNTQEFSEGTVILGDVAILDMESGETIIIGDEPLITELKYRREISVGKDVYPSCYVAYFSVDNLDLNYGAYELKFNLTIESNEKVVSEKVTLKFEKDYREYERNAIKAYLSSIT